MKRTTRAKSKAARRQAKAEVARQVADMGREGEESMWPTSKEVYRGWLAALEDAEREREEDRSRRSIDVYDDYADDYLEPIGDHDDYDRWESGDDAYENCEHCHVQDAVGAIGGLMSHMTAAERQELAYMAMRLRQLKGVLDGRAAERRNARKAS